MGGLQETFEKINRPSDPQTGEMELLITRFSYEDPLEANRVAAQFREYVADPALKTSLATEVIQTPEGNYRIRADWV